MSLGVALLAGALLASAAWRMVVVASSLRQASRVPRVSELPEPPIPPDPPLVSVLVPARNEEGTIGACLASLSAQRYAPLEIVVADDASSDGTPAIVAAAAGRDPRVRAVRVPDLPPGWLGKSFALSSAVPLARGAWLCFTDADTVHAPEAIGRALGFAHAHRLDLLSLTSRQLTGSFWERVVQPVVFGLLDRWFPLSRVNDPRSPLAAANGIFILVAREAYEAAGGHRAVGGEILEDVALARNVKRGGGRILFADGADLVAARMYEGFASIRRGWTKNLYALSGGRPGPALGRAAELLLTAVGPSVAGVAFLVAGRGPLALVGGLATLAVLAAEVPSRARRGYDPCWALTLPLGAAAVAAFLLESAIRDWLGLGMRWKDRQYTLDP